MTVLNTCNIDTCRFNETKTSTCKHSGISIDYDYHDDKPTCVSFRPKASRNEEDY